MTSKYNKQLNKKRKEIVSTGRKDPGYMSTHSGYTAKHKKPGCGLAVLIVGLIMSSSAGVALTYILDVL